MGECHSKECRSSCTWNKIREETQASTTIKPHRSRAIARPLGNYIVNKQSCGTGTHNEQSARVLRGQWSVDMPHDHVQATVAHLKGHSLRNSRTTLTIIPHVSLTPLLTPSTESVTNHGIPDASPHATAPYYAAPRSSWFGSSCNNFKVHKRASRWQGRSRHSPAERQHDNEA